MVGLVQHAFVSVYLPFLQRERELSRIGVVSTHTQLVCECYYYYTLAEEVIFRLEIALNNIHTYGVVFVHYLLVVFHKTWPRLGIFV